MWPFRRKQHREPLQWQPTPPTAVITDDGRRHLVQVPYLLPKDVLEENRLNFQHYFVKSILSGNYAAPIFKDITSILDVGCGTGVWVRELAKEFPSARVIGLDLEPPAHGNQGAFEGGAIASLPNCLFVKGNVFERLPYDNATFDFVHQRFLLAAIPAAKWQGVVNELVRVTKRGGWIELFEVSASYPQSGPAQQQFLRWGNAAAQQVGIDYSYAFRLPEMLSRAGLHEIRSRILRVPIGSWGGHAGQMLAQDTVEAYKTLLPLFQRKLGIAPAQFEAIVDALPQEWETCHTAFEFPFAYGQC